MDLNFRVFATGVRIFRASNDVGPLCVGPGSTRILEKTQSKKWWRTAKFLIIVDFSDFLKNKRMECTNLVGPHQLLCHWFTLVFVLFCIYTPTICSQDRLLTKAEVYFGFSQKYSFGWLHKDFVLGAPILMAIYCTFPEHLSIHRFQWGLCWSCSVL